MRLIDSTHPHPIGRRLLIGLLILAGLLLALFLPAPAGAKTLAQQADMTPMAGDHGARPDLACRLCHDDTDGEIEFPSGQRLPARVDLAALDASVHGQPGAALTCTGCHQPANNYRVPHAPPFAVSVRAYQSQQSETCTRCHVQPHLTSHPGPESDRPVLCVDCHTGHEVQPAAAWDDPAAVEACLACHEVEEQERLAVTVRDGLFAEQEDSAYCLACHGQPGLTKTFPNGDEVSLTINAARLHASVHGAENAWRALECSDCHGDYAFPHPETAAESYREYSLNRYTLCADCHQRFYERTQNSTHDRARAEGIAEAAVCTDCHGAHDTPVPDEPRSRISATCSECHATIYQEYRQSVHGAALIEGGNLDVPSCVECHGVHDIQDPRTNLFRIRSPELCAGCHADEELMARYDISTDVFSTYVADFHGTTVTLFEHQDPNAETNKAVCYDCHGVHKILDPQDPDAGIKANLLETCRQCHPDASQAFSDSWTSHFEPSLEHNPIVYLVNLFYQIVIPLTVGFFAIVVSTDIYRRVRTRTRRAPRSDSE